MKQSTIKLIKDNNNNTPRSKHQSAITHDRQQEPQIPRDTPTSSSIEIQL